MNVLCSWKNWIIAYIFSSFDGEALVFTTAASLKPFCNELGNHKRPVEGSSVGASFIYTYTAFAYIEGKNELKMLWCYSLCTVRDYILVFFNFIVARITQSSNTIFLSSSGQSICPLFAWAILVGLIIKRISSFSFALLNWAFATGNVVQFFLLSYYVSWAVKQQRYCPRGSFFYACFFENWIASPVGSGSCEGSWTWAFGSLEDITRSEKVRFCLPYATQIWFLLLQPKFVSDFHLVFSIRFVPASCYLLGHSVPI